VSEPGAKAWPKCYVQCMTQDDVRAVLERVLTWPRKRQEQAVELLACLEAQDDSEYQLNDEQAAEVRRRLAEKDAPTLTLEQLDARLRRRGT
jgi:hypothetical protein